MYDPIINTPHFRDMVSASDEVVNTIKRTMNMCDFKSALGKISEDYEYNKKCIWCLGPFNHGNQKSFCSKDHQHRFQDYFLWEWVRERVKERNVCERCGRDLSIPYWHEAIETKSNNPLMQDESCWVWVDIENKNFRRHKFYDYTYGQQIWQIHHRQPINANGGGGSFFDPYNLELLCSECHGKAHAELNKLEKDEKWREQWSTLDDFTG